MDMNLSKLLKIVEDWEGWCVAVHGIAELDLVNEQQKFPLFTISLFQSRY